MIQTKIKELRISANLTQRELGDKLNLANNTIANYESGNRTPDFATLIKMANLFDVSTDYLLGHESKKSTTKNECNDDSNDEYSKYLEKEYWDLIKKLNVVEIKVFKSIIDSGFSLLDLNNALKELLEKKKSSQ